MNCNAIQLLLPDFSDNLLDASRQAAVRAHLAACADCAGLAKAQEETRGLLRALPPRQASAQFEARLADRLALVRRPAPRAAWWERAAASLRVPPRALRPALALCAAAVAVVGVTLRPASHPVNPSVGPVLSENTLVSQCVAQHQTDVAAQPLADPAAQNLTDRLGGSASAAPTDTGVAEENL